MQLTINHPSAWISASLFKPFLLIGVAGISSVALYTPLSSQAEELKAKVKDSAVTPVLPFVDKTFEGAGKLFGQLGNWAKAGANNTDTVKKWISDVAGGSVSNGAKQIYETLKVWGWKVYKFIESLFNKDVWERIKNNIKMLGNFLNLFKNLMKAELNGNASIFNKVLGVAGKDGFGEVASALGDIATNHPELLGDMNDKEVSDLISAIDANPEGMGKMLQEMAKDENLTKEQLLNAARPSTLVGQIKEALKRAKEFENKDTLNEGPEKERANKLYIELKELYSELEKLIQTEKAKAKE